MHSKYANKSKENDLLQPDECADKHSSCFIRTDRSGTILAGKPPEQSADDHRRAIRIIINMVLVNRCIVCCWVLTIILLLPYGRGQWTSHLQSEGQDSTAPTSGNYGGSGFGYELLRNQLDDIQASISQLQQNGGCCSEYEAGIATLQTGITTLQRRLEGIEKRLKELQKSATLGDSRDNRVNQLNGLMEKLENVIRNAHGITARPPEVQTTTSSYDKVYDSCDDVPSSGTWLIRFGRQITNTVCYKY